MTAAGKAKRTKAHRPFRQGKNTVKQNEKGHRNKVTATGNDLDQNSPNHKKKLFPPSDGTQCNDQFYLYSDNQERYHQKKPNIEGTNKNRKTRTTRTAQPAEQER